MIFTLGLRKLPFSPDSKQIIYVGGKKDEKVTELIQHHFCSIRIFFLSHGYTFCYIPYVMRDLLSGERLNYNAPFAKAHKEADYMVDDNFILDYMIHPENREKVTPSLLYYDRACLRPDYVEAEDQLRGITISESSFTGNCDLREVLEDILADIRKQKEKKTIRFHRLPLDHFDDLLLRDGDEEHASEEDILYRDGDEEDASDDDLLFREGDEDEILCSYGEEAKMLTADLSFDDESIKLIDEIKDRIEKLRQKGIDSYLLGKMFSKKEALISRMRITNDYRIFLTDYDNMEIEMYPLDKAVYLLFLRHPEGIIFRFLPDYRRELMEIYSKLKPSLESTASLRSIEDVTDPTLNSINEKCAHIRAAFISKFDEHLARTYFITGARSEPKGIILPRGHVTWEKPMDIELTESFVTWRKFE